MASVCVPAAQLFAYSVCQQSRLVDSSSTFQVQCHGLCRAISQRDKSKLYIPRLTRGSLAKGCRSADSKVIRRTIVAATVEVGTPVEDELTANAALTAGGEGSETPPEVVKAVLFDMDGVLCDSEERSREAAVELFAEMGVSVSTSDFIPFMGTGEANFLGGVARVYNVPFDVAKAKQRFFEIYITKHATPNSGLGYEGALALVEQCKAAGLRLAVASSADRIKVDANLSAAGLPQTNFDAVVSADKFERLKPAPDIFLAAAEALGVPPSQCVVIEDALAGVQAARAAGMRCIAVTTTLGKEPLVEAGPSLVRSDISAITLSDILTLNSPPPTIGGSSVKPASKSLAKSAGGDSFQNFVNETINLPFGYEMTRRDALRLGSLLVGSSALYVAFSRLKAMSYASPQALFNMATSAFSLPSKANADEDRVAKFRGFIADLENRGGGTKVPEFEPKLQWLNSAPLRIQNDLSGKVVLLDFWTYCCINCMHILPDLAFLEKKFKDQPVTVVGVHSAKFDNEKDIGAIRNAVLRYDVTHPVVNDGEMTMWRALGVSSWPTIAVVSPAGRLIGMLSGENHRQDLDDLLTAALGYYGEKGLLDNKPIPEALERDKDARLVGSPLKFPGKIATDLANGRLFISDSNNHRIVVTDLGGSFITQVGGAGGEGFRDGSLDTAAFNRPQGLAYHSGKDVLYVADTENHALREIDFVNGQVRTLAGNGSKGSDYSGGRKGQDQVLNSPWDVVVDDRSGYVFVAMAGQHQIWRHDIETGVTKQFSGDGYERNRNGRDGTSSSYAQPSGLSLTAGREKMYVADSESSSVRTVDVQTGGSNLCAGGDAAFADNLFQFGDVDGAGSRAKLQHPLGVLCAPDGTVFIADSYNHKIKVMDPSSNQVRTLVGSGTAGFRDGSGSSAQLSEPAGLALGPGGSVYVADTNNNVIRILDVAPPSLSNTRAGAALKTLELSSVPPPAAEAPPSPGTATAGARKRLRRRALPEAEVVRLSTVNANQGQLQLQVTIPQGYHFTKGAVSKFEAESDVEGAVLLEPSSGDFATTNLTATSTLAFQCSPDADTRATVRVNCKMYYCQEDDVCLYKAIVFEVPLNSQQQVPNDSSSAYVPLNFNVIPKNVALTTF